ncbi:hypothetical protein DAEQUDRAFT_766748 [Daedalea quercina L-15889]|uniref:Uncharacterized protein n=1 Tax=Daedalea quercina L-15889 TaxID=1314783 RepID=A0A165PAY4_9APHY|nr:hypothetical protein DAEQUDRAFT_766748 [Daedalea quercina L-15889]
MISALHSPVLSVAADVVRELEGEDALSGLWALFTKCKESLKDGRRLENLSWRLWYREIAAQQTFTSPGSLSPPFSEKQRSPTPITPISEEDEGAHEHALSPQPTLQTVQDIQAHSWHGDVARLNVLSANRRLSSASVPGHRPTQQVVPVGRLIIDILPGELNLVVPSEKSRAAKPAVHPRPAPAPDASGRLPSRPVVSVQTPSTPPSATLNFPKVVVVNPTPHPTPPATPQMPPRTTPALPSSAQAPAHLLPPSPTRTMIAPPSPAIHPVEQPVNNRKAPTVPQPLAPTSTSHEVPAQHKQERNDETLKASDRRFFLQGAVSPEQDSPDSHSSVSASTSNVSHKTDARSDEHVARSPSSATSSQLSQLRSDGGGGGGGSARGPGAAAKRGMMRAHTRKSKETVRHAPVRPTAIRAQTQTHVSHRATGARKGANSGEAKKTTFNIGSVSSNGSRAGPSKRREEPPMSSSKSRQLENSKVSAAAATAPQRRGIVVTESSEYETTDSEDDSEWASDTSPSEREREREARMREEGRLRQAAEEAQRQRDMFAKVPRRSYTSMPRTQSGLLSQLLNPDPNLFPPNHPYRRGFSSQDMTQYARQAPPPPVQTSKSSVALPQAAAVVAQAPLTDGVHASTVRAKGTSTTATATATATAARTKGRPQSAELDEDTDSESENPDNGIQVSRSLAQQKLAALADSSRRRHSDRGPPPLGPAVRPQIPSVATAPIPLGHPYNLPAPAPPMTPRTTRRQMLSTELSESLRRNLLWERQVSRNNMMAPKRNGLLGNGLRPLTAVHDQSRNNGSGSKSGDEDEAMDERKRRTVARNRSWADDYHYAGW